LDDYITPNEAHPEGIKEHLDNAESGVHVVSGTERSFFHLLFADHKNVKASLFVISITEQ